MKLFDLLKVIEGGEYVCVRNEEETNLAGYLCDDFVHRCAGGSVIVREENNDPSLLDKEVVYVYVAVIDEYGLPGVIVIVR